jgi:hypothetical protein
MARGPGSEERRLEVLIGTWRTEGRTTSTDGGPAAEIEATDSYEWLTGRFALLHRVDARVGDERVEGAEIIGWDPARHAYVTQYFGSDGPNSYEATLGEEDGGLVWRMASGSDRFAGAFSVGGSQIEGAWEQLAEDGTWTPWMEVTLRKLSE